VSPINGKIDFLNFLKTDDYVQNGQELFKIVPEESAMIGQVLLPEQGSGKVVKGQEVIIKLDNYPYTQFGSIKGKVENISLATNQQTLSNSQNKINAYLVVVTLPKGLYTNYGTTLNFHFEAKGTAEIITDNRRLIERLFDNLKYSLK
jgi:multidrug resistance efflux pump